jgi:hypothetical protein
MGDNETPRHGLEHGHEAMQVYAATCTPIAVIGDLPAISVIMSDSSADYPLQVKIWLNGIRSRRLHVGVQLSPVVSTPPDRG